MEAANKLAAIVIEEVEDELEETLIPRDEDDGLSERQLAMLGGKQLLK